MLVDDQSILNHFKFRGYAGCHVTDFVRFKRWWGRFNISDPVMSENILKSISHRCVAIMHHSIVSLPHIL